MKQLCENVYEEMGWNKEWKYRFRGVSRHRGESSIVLFRLEEPVILPNKRGEHITPPSAEEWSGQLNCRFNRMSKRLTEDDIMVQGSEVINPLIGELPPHEELKRQLDQLLLSMG